MAKKIEDFSDRVLTILKKKFPTHNFTVVGASLKQIAIDGVPSTTRWSMAELWVPESGSPKDAVKALEQEIVKGVHIDLEEREGRKLFDTSIIGVLEGLKKNSTLFYRLRARIALAFYDEVKKRHFFVTEKKLLDTAQTAATTFLTEWIKGTAKEKSGSTFLLTL
jgi:hypothetical protein